MGEVIEIENRLHFEETVINSGKPSIVDFWAPGCTACKFMEDDFEEASKDFVGEVRFARVNTQENEEIAEIMRIRSIPTIVTFRGPAVFDIRVGRTTKKGILRMARRVLDEERGVGFWDKLKRLFD